MKQYYLLGLVQTKYFTNKISISELYKTEFTRPYCIIDILSREVKKLNVIFRFVLTNDVDYLFKFYDVKNVDELFEMCKSFYNKGNIACGFTEYFLKKEIIRVFIDLSSKNFSKYYSFSDTGMLENYNKLICDITCYKEHNKKRFLVDIKPLYSLSKSKNNKKYITNIINVKSLLFYTNSFNSKEFKQFNSFRDLVLHCINTYKYRFNKCYNKIIKSKFKKHFKYNIINEYFDILEDITKGIEL